MVSTERKIHAISSNGAPEATISVTIFVANRPSHDGLWLYFVEKPQKFT
jgi:hypothetical protein